MGTATTTARATATATATASRATSHDLYVWDIASDFPVCTVHAVVAPGAPLGSVLANGALPHYVAGPEAALELQPEGMFLLDSGGQYEDGTTDTTRTAYLGAAPSAHQKRCCALLTDTQIHTSLS